MKKLLLASIAISGLVLWAVSCGGGGGGGGTPTGPSTNPPAGPSTNPPAGPSPTPPAQTSTTVNIVSSSGAGAFSPNPVQVPSSGSIEWRNSTADLHVLVMNNGTSIGTVAPGASLTTPAGAGGSFRCMNHPTMVGSINGAVPPPPQAPPGTPPDYDYAVPKSVRAAG